MNTQIDLLLQELDRAAQAAEALKAEIADKDASGIVIERIELAKAILAVNELHREIAQELSK